MRECLPECLPARTVVGLAGGLEGEKIRKLEVIRY
jgi:hypothetical protein